MSSELHPLLRRQLRRVGCEDGSAPDPAAFQKLLARVSQAYASAEEDRYTVERALEVSSKEMQQLNGALRDERDKVQAVISDGLCHLDVHGSIRSINPEGVRLTGLDPSESNGRDFFECVRLFVGSANADPIDETSVRAAVREGQPCREEDAVLERHDGTRIPVSAAFNPIVSRGQVVGSMLVLRDSTERRVAEQQLREANAELSAARDAAEAASEAKSRFLATMSHEIRTPMHGLLGTLALLLDSTLDREQRDYATTASRSAERLLAIIDDVLDFSKIEAGRLDIEHVEFDLRGEVEGAVSLYAEAKARDVQLACFVANDVPDRVVGDPTRLRQVLTNLVGNAVKFTAEGHIVLRVTQRDTADGLSALRFEVEDTGIGIPQQVRANIFDAFTQADDSTTRKYGGTGLGLSICRDLTGLMGGELQIDSEEGQGSTFWFELPLEVGVDDRERDARDLEGHRVLVVDDFEVNRAILDSYLTQWGASVHVASDGEEALRLLGGGMEFDLAVLDFQMPGVDGIELAALIRANPGCESLPIVLLSSSQTDRGAARRAGIETVLRKPIRRSALRDALCDAAGVTRTGATVPEEIAARLEGRVLLVEDNLVNQRVAVAMLRSLGVEADVANDGVEGVQLAGRRSYDLVLMDCQMPRMDGFEAAREIRAREAGTGRRVPIVAMTANATRQDRERCLDSGMDDHLPKPTTKQALEEALKRWLLRLAGRPA